MRNQICLSAFEGIFRTKFAGITGALVCGVILSSCASQRGRLPKPLPAADRPAHFGEATAVKAARSTTPEVFDTRPKIRGKMLELIEGAEDYILIDSYLVVKSADTMDVLEALRKRKNAGVKIYVLSDSSSLYYRPGEGAFDYMKEAGIPCAEFNPMRYHKLIVAPTMLPRDHRKFWVVDGKVLFLGGANILAHSLNPPEQGGNHDVMVSVESADAIRELIASFVKDWNESSKLKLRKGSFPVKATKAPETDLWLFDQKDPGEKGKGVILGMIDSLFSVAKKEVWLIQPYTFVNDAFLDRVRFLADRGVEVNLMLCGNSHAPKYHYASFYGIKDILEAGGKVWVYNKGQGTLHTKAIVVDRRCASIGSANFNHRSYFLSKEANVVFEDPKSVGKVVRVLDELRAECRPVGMSEARRYRTGQYYANWLFMQWTG